MLYICYIGASIYHHIRGATFFFVHLGGKHTSNIWLNDSFFGINEQEQTDTIFI